MDGYGTHRWTEYAGARGLALRCHDLPSGKLNDGAVGEARQEIVHSRLHLTVCATPTGQSVTKRTADEGRAVA